MAAEAGTGQRYATQVGSLWSGLTGTLTRLETLAADQEHLRADDAPATLRRLQFRLHAACERAFGLVPPLGAESMHTELADALEGARDATGEIAEVLEADGVEAAEPLVYEWRGALFRVRLARLRLTTSPERELDPAFASDAPPPISAFIALGLASVGAVVFTLGAGTGLWPVWITGITVLCASFLVYKP